MLLRRAAGAVSLCGIFHFCFLPPQFLSDRPAAIEPTLFTFIWKHSKRDQIVLLLVTLVLFPLLYLTLELPKRIINDAIGAGRSVIPVAGMDLSQTGYLWLLCFLFLASVLLHGLMKMKINTMKGMLAERLLRRLRYSLIARILRFPAPYFETTSQGELVSMVTAEVEPMGGLMGDAVAQPVLQAGQMITVMVFLFAQSPLFGLAACALIPLQAWLIPVLQRRINALNKRRILEVRALSSQIGENAVGAATLRANGGWRLRLAQVSQRLALLYKIRLEIFKKKFFMKFLNNFITQLTPFFFYAIGGALVIRGDISIGALVAALAAFKELTSPWKELLAYYTQMQDLSLRWRTVMARFVPAGMLAEDKLQDPPEKAPPLDGDILLDKVTVQDVDGTPVLQDISAHLRAGATLAITAPSSEERAALAQVLAGAVHPASGSICVNGTALTQLHQSTIAARIGLADPAPVIFSGSLGTNILMPLMMRPHPREGEGATDTSQEALKSGNSPDDPDADWLDASLSLPGGGDLRDWWLAIIRALGQDDAFMAAALDQRLAPGAHPALARNLIDLRPRIATALSEAGLRDILHRFEEDSYNPALPVADNLLFAISQTPLTGAILADHTAFMALLKERGLDQDLLNLSFDVIDMLRQTFGAGGTDHPLFRKLGLEDAAFTKALSLTSKHREGTPLSAAEQAHLLAIPFVLSAEKIGSAFPEDIKTRILRLRAVQGRRLLGQMGDLFAPIAPDICLPGLTVLENLVFGKIADGAGNKDSQLRAIVAQVLRRAGMASDLTGLLFDMPLSIGGANLPAQFREPLGLSRAVIKRPDVLVLDGISADKGEAAQLALADHLKALLPQMTLIFLNASWDAPEHFDQHFEVKDGRMLQDPAQDGQGDATSLSADLARKVAALKQTDLFSGLAAKQLRLLAFGARWFDAPAGTRIFGRGDDPSDGAYMVLEGTAHMQLPRPNSAPKLIATVGPGQLVGELGLIRTEARALDMIAAQDMKCLRIGTEAFLAVVQSDAETAFKLLQVVSGYAAK